MSFSLLGLSGGLLRAIAAQGYTEPTPIQAQAIPVVLSGRDLLATAQTGTGKTAAFTLPLLQRLQANADKRSTSRRPITALVLTPTRELAAQVADSIRAYGRQTPARSAAIFGGVRMKPQIDALRQGVDILVATPGRLLDHVNQRTLNLASVEILVLDEADRMLDMGFLPDIKRILALLPKRRQNLLFSATLPETIRRFADELLVDHVTIDVAPRNAPAERVSHQVHRVDRERKQALLTHLMNTGDWRQALVFTRTKHAADRLARQLDEDGIRAAAMHGDKTQNVRMRTLADFKRGKVRVLVATDIAARGIDIDQLGLVVNFDLPAAPEDYVHRIGRTGRAGCDGTALSLVSHDETRQLMAIQRFLGLTLPSSVVEGFTPTARRSPASAGPASRKQAALGRAPAKPFALDGETTNARRPAPRHAHRRPRLDSDPARPQQHRARRPERRLPTVGSRG